MNKSSITLTLVFARFPGERYSNNAVIWLLDRDRNPLEGQEVCSAMTRGLNEGVKIVRTNMHLAASVCLIAALIIDGVDIQLNENVVAYTFILTSMNQPQGAWPLALPCWL